MLGKKVASNDGSGVRRSYAVESVQGASPRLDSLIGFNGSIV